ncbi:MAG: hypothetical protein AAFW73_11345, partial [Bacteroidota bacterium]
LTGLRIVDEASDFGIHWCEAEVIEVDIARAGGDPGPNLNSGTIQQRRRVINFDDFRFAPVDAEIACFVYDPQTSQVTHILDQDHLYTEYIYDDGGRLIQVFRETTENPTGKQLENEYDIHYKRPYN